MKRLFVSFVIVVVMVGVGVAQEAKKNVLGGSVYVETTLKNRVWTPELQVYLTYAGKSKLGSFCWIQANKGYHQFYCGPSYDVRSWISVAAGLGAETGSKNPFKFGGSVWTGNSKVQNLFIVEKGLGSKSSGLWLRDQFTVKVTNKTSVCVAHQSFQGTGGCVEQSISKKVMLRGEVLLNQTSPIVKVGVKFKF